MAAPPLRPTQPPLPTGKGIYLGSPSVIGIKAAAAAIGVVMFGLYAGLIAYPESEFWMIGIVLGLVGVILGVIGIFLGNMRISPIKWVPPINILLIIVSIILILAMPIFGSWQDPNTIGESLWKIGNLVNVLIFAILFLCYVELAHASIRFSQIDEYSISHNLKEFNVSSVIINYAMWIAILMVIIALISACVLLLQVGLSVIIRDVAPQFGYSLEYNSIYSILISIAIIFVPIGIVTAFVYGTFVKSRRAIVVKGKEDVVARRPDMVKVK